MSSYKSLSKSPISNTIGETLWDYTNPSNTWIAPNQVLSQSTYSDLYAKVGLIKNGLYSWNRSATGTTSTIRSVEYGNGLYVYGGVGGVLATSTDAITWTARTSGTTSQINAVAYLNGLYVYAGTGGVLRTSTNAITWTARTSGTTGSILNITYGNGLYAYASSTNIHTSTDAITWTMLSDTTIKRDTSNQIANFQYLNNLFIYYQASGLAGNFVTSTDTVTWNQVTVQQPQNPKNWNSVTYVNNEYVAIDNEGQASTSTNGVTWTTIDLQSQFPGTHLSRLIYANDSYMAAPSFTLSDTVTFNTKSLLYTSTNLTTGWKSLQVPVPVNPVGLIYAGNKYIYFGALGTLYWTTEYTYNTSTEFVTPPINFSINNQNSNLYLKGI